MTGEIALRPSYWASVSGGKDSLYMLNLILHNLDRYPLDGVVHFELEIDYPFIHDVIDYMETECKRFGIRFVRIKPRKTWEELVRLLNLYQADLLNQNRENIENGITKYFVPGVKAQYEHARIISTKLSVELGKCIKTW